MLMVYVHVRARTPRIYIRGGIYLLRKGYHAEEQEGLLAYAAVGKFKAVFGIKGMGTIVTISRSTRRRLRRLLHAAAKKTGETQDSSRGSWGFTLKYAYYFLYCKKCGT